MNSLHKLHTDLSAKDSHLTTESCIYGCALCGEWGSEDCHVTDKIPHCCTGWRRTPRSPADFSDSVSSFHDSDYFSWLNNYYNALHLQEQQKICSPKYTSTSDLAAKTTEQAVLNGDWSDNTTYSKLNGARKHWPLHYKYLTCDLFPLHYPHLNVSSRYGRYHYQWHTGAAIPEVEYRKKLGLTIIHNLQELNKSAQQLKHLKFWDTLANISWFDSVIKKEIIKLICSFFRKQHQLEMVCLENCGLSGEDGVFVLCSLSQNSGDVIKELHIWKMYKWGQNPLLIDHVLKGRKIDQSISNECHFVESISSFSVLTHLSINYAYLANQKGDVLLELKCIRYGRLTELRILCLEEEMPLKANPGQGVGGWTIEDGVWRRTKELCPQLKVMFVFINLPKYEDIVRFLSKSIPMSYVYLSSGIDLRFQSPWSVDSTLLTLSHWYGSTLDTLCLHLWHQRDRLDVVIRSKILVEFPNLESFEFIGILEDLSTLEVFCQDLASGKFNLKKLLFWVEEKKCFKKVEGTNMAARVSEIAESYRSRFQYFGIDADIKTYPA